MLLILGTFGLFLARVSAQGPPPSEDSKFMVVLRSSIECCDDVNCVDAVDPSGLFTEMPNPSTSYINGFVNFIIPVTDDHTLELTLNKQENNQEKMIMSVSMNFCEELIDPESDYAPILEHLVASNSSIKACPLQGEQKMDRYVIDVDEMPLKRSDVGRFRAAISLYNKSRDLIWCIFVDFDIELAE